MTPNEVRQNAVQEAEKTLKDFGEDPDHSRTLITKWADAVMAHSVTLAAWELEGMPVHAVGSTGQLCSHPMLRELREQEGHIAKLATALNLTPESRSKRRVGSGIGGNNVPKDRARVTSIRKAA
jgi:phage terminase small subunit